jgi:hypothetical protein
MLFANYCGNGYYKRQWKKDEDNIKARDINFGISDNTLKDEA